MKTAILLIEKPISGQNIPKTAHLASYDQEINDFLDRNFESRVRETSDESQKESSNSRHHRWRIRHASGSKQPARATPKARSACFVPRCAWKRDLFKEYTMVGYGNV